MEKQGNEGQTGVHEVYGWDPVREDYFLVYRGTDEAEAKRAGRKAARDAKKYYREHGYRSHMWPDEGDSG